MRTHMSLPFAQKKNPNPQVVQITWALCLAALFSFTAMQAFAVCAPKNSSEYNGGDQHITPWHTTIQHNKSLWKNVDKNVILGRSFAPKANNLKTASTVPCRLNASTPATLPSKQVKHVESEPQSEILEPSNSFPNYNINPLAPDITGMGSTAAQLAKRIHLGWNIGNTMEAIGDETAWGNPRITSELISLVKDSGFDSIRLPVSWNEYADQSTAKIDDAWMMRVKEVVQICMEHNLTVLVNIHWDNGWLENNVNRESQNAVNAKQKALWQQIATEFRDFDERLMFASANEPSVEDAEQMRVLLSYHQTFVDTVRSTGGKNAYRILVVQGPKTDVQKTYKLMHHLPTDTIENRLMAEVHFYSPYQFTLMAENAGWGKQFFYWGNGNHSKEDTDHNTTWGEEAYIDDIFKKLQTKFVDQGVPIILGEYGAMRRTDQLSGSALELHLRSRAAWHRYVTKSAIQHGLIPYYWDNGGTNSNAFGIFDRRSNTVADPQTLESLKIGKQ